jgi:hypothetical protein
VPRISVAYKVNGIALLENETGVIDVEGHGTIVWDLHDLCGCSIRDPLLACRGMATLRPCSRHEAELHENAAHE